MGYSTALYAVDLDKLKAVVGSADATTCVRRIRGDNRLGENDERD